MFFDSKWVAVFVRSYIAYAPLCPGHVPRKLFVRPLLQLPREGVLDSQCMASRGRSLRERSFETRAQTLWMFCCLITMILEHGGRCATLFWVCWHGPVPVYLLNTVVKGRPGRGRVIIPSLYLKRTTLRKEVARCARR